MTITNHPTVTIILPTYNRGYCIEKSIKSLLAQSFKDFELIISDDGSTDDTSSLIASIDDKRIRYIRNETQKGANIARNLGIKSACGHYVAFHDSDDEWMPDKLELQLEALKRCDGGGKVCFCGFIRINKNKKIYIPKKSRRIESGLHNFHNELLKGNFITTPSLIVEKKLLHKVGLFDENLNRFQDWDLVLRLSQSNEFVFVDQPLTIAYINDDSITRKKGLWRGVEKIVEKYKDDFCTQPTSLLIQYINICISAVVDKEFGIFGKYFMKTILLIIMKPSALFIRR